MSTTPTTEAEETIGNTEQDADKDKEAIVEQDRDAIVEEDKDIEGEDRPTKKLKSIVWDHFVKLPVEKDGQHRAQCNHCKVKLLCHPHLHGTNGLKKHIDRCPQNPNKLDKMKQAMFRNVSGTVSHHLFSQERCRRAVAKFIILDEMPFNTVEGEGFRLMMNEVEPRFQIPSRTTVTRDCLKLYVEEAEKLRSYFKRSKVRVSFTTDTWTSNQNANYMCLTAHWIDEEWQLQKRILNFGIVENHKGDTIADEIERCLLWWGIDRVFTITVDNASSNDNALSTLKSVFRHWNGLVCDGEFLQLRCCAHVLNLIVSDGVKDMNSCIEAIRNAVKYVRSSPSRFRKFKELVEKMKIDSKSLLSMDCPTRWNSTYIMLDNAIKFSSVFERMEELDTEYKKYFLDKSLIGPPTSLSFMQAKEFVAFLKVFYNVTLKFSGSLYVTSHLAFQQINNVSVLLRRRANNRSSLLCQMARNMQGKYEKYWGNFENFNPLLVIAVVLDPRYKMKFLRFAFEDMFPDPARRDDMSSKVSAVLYRLYDHYANTLDTSQCEGQSQTQVPIAYGSRLTDEFDRDLFGYDDEEGSDAIERFIAHNEIEIQTDKYAELDRYLQAEFANQRDPNFNILDWWKVNGSKYKVLSLIARDVLAMPVSTVSSESAFSTGGRVIDEFRSSLSPKMVEALICTQNWLAPSTSKLKGLDSDYFNQSHEAEHDEEVGSNLVCKLEEPKK